VKLAVLTISDAASRGARDDRSGDAIVSWAASGGHEVVARAVVPDETERIARTLMTWADGGNVDVILTTGGTGITARDVTPEATRAVLEKEAPGFAEAIRAAGLVKLPRAMLSRGVAGTRGKTLIINLPGSTSGVTDGLATLAPVLEHAAALLRGQTEH
jgi:molybdenum cofactor biosynthesis protein B